MEHAKCRTCGCEWFVLDENNNQVCEKCGKNFAYDYADLRAFRRQVLLSIVRTGHWRIDGLKELWETADRIARAEPKE
jgi:hypothetical protein